MKGAVLKVGRPHSTFVQCLMRLDGGGSEGKGGGVVFCGGEVVGFCW
jgi:hypothetical protein